MKAATTVRSTVVAAFILAYCLFPATGPKLPASLPLCPRSLPMADRLSRPRRFDAPTLELIVVVMLTTLHDFLLSDVLSLPGALRGSRLGQLRALDRVASSLEIGVPVVVLLFMVVLWLLGRNAWVS